MKILDPQAALLTIGEVHQFLTSRAPRPTDKKIGSYKSVNLHNSQLVQRDLETYLNTTTPYVRDQPPLEQWMTELVSKLKKYQLTKTEVFALINLGIGLNEASPPARAEDDEGQADVNGDDAEVKDEGDAAEDVDEAGESGLDRMLFGLVIEEADERFTGDDGEERIIEILGILKETIKGTKDIADNNRVNGH